MPGVGLSAGVPFVAGLPYRTPDLLKAAGPLTLVARFILREKIAAAPFWPPDVDHAVPVLLGSPPPALFAGSILE